jgi:hypothetical protein
MVARRKKQYAQLGSRSSHLRHLLKIAIAKKLTLHLRFEWIALHKKRLGQFQIEIVIHLF